MNHQPNPYETLPTNSHHIVGEAPVYQTPEVNGQGLQTPEYQQVEKSPSPELPRTIIEAATELRNTAVAIDDLRSREIKR